MKVTTIKLSDNIKKDLTPKLKTGLNKPVQVVKMQVKDRHVTCICGGNIDLLDGFAECDRCHMS